MGSAEHRASLPTILIVEDEFLARAMLSDHLQECGFMVFEAGSADEAITTIETGIPIDLVLTDIRMPGSMNGFGLAKWISANKPKISVILASGEATQTDAANELCDHIPFFKKPYDLKAIVARIRALSTTLKIIDPFVKSSSKFLKARGVSRMSLRSEMAISRSPEFFRNLKIRSNCRTRAGSDFCRRLRRE